MAFRCDGDAATGLNVTPAVTLVVKRRAAQQHKRLRSDLRRSVLQTLVNQCSKLVRSLHGQSVYQGHFIDAVGSYVDLEHTRCGPVLYGGPCTGVALVADAGCVGALRAIVD